MREVYDKLGQGVDSDHVSGVGVVLCPGVDKGLPSSFSDPCILLLSGLQLAFQYDRNE